MLNLKRKKSILQNYCPKLHNVKGCDIDYSGIDISIKDTKKEETYQKQTKFIQHTKYLDNEEGIRRKTT